jgi:hypothetical protein
MATAATAFNPEAIERVRKETLDDAIVVFQDIDDRLGPYSVWPIEYQPAEVAQQRFRNDLSSISGDDATLYRVVDEVMWDVLKMSARAAAHHDAAVQARVDTVTATVLDALSRLSASKPLMTYKDSLLYRCVREIPHAFGPKTLKVIASRHDQCFREKELLDAETMALFEGRYHHNALDGYTARTCRPPPYSALV